jgi:hypothetical protein
MAKVYSIEAKRRFGNAVRQAMGRRREQTRDVSESDRALIEAHLQSKGVTRLPSGPAEGAHPGPMLVIAHIRIGEP